MTTLAVRDANDVVRYLSMSGSGDQGDPFIPNHFVAQEVATSFFVRQLQIAIAGDVTQLPAQPLTRGVLLKALSTNNGSVFVGNSDVSAATGFELDKGSAILVRIDELSKLYFVTTAANEGLCLMGD